MCVSFETNLFISRRGDVQHNMKRVANSILPFLDPDIVLNRPCLLTAAACVSLLGTGTGTGTMDV